MTSDVSRSVSGTLTAERRIKKSAEANFVNNLRVISEKMAFETEADLPPSLACLKVGCSYV